MTTLETIVQELQHVPPERLDEVYQLVLALKAPPEANKELAEWTMQFAGMLNHWTEEEWADFQAELQRTRATLFNRPVPEL
ncbi:hypothetical protein [uncultured Hymenobacter sp.]|uniref:hypothetical protein n=1 Tax=uncultured Hymenobacter sp. TaxID=170016 RepID=UPI0035CC0E32